MTDERKFPCAFCDRQDYVKMEIDREGEVWTLCQSTYDALTGEEHPDEDCHWTAHGHVDTVWPEGE